MLPEQTAHPRALSSDEIRETERLAALDRLDAIDTPRDEVLDGIVRLVKNVFDVPIAIVSVLDAHRQIYKASEGIKGEEQPRSTAFCNHTILGSQPMVVADARLDRRFAENPLVAGQPHVRFYAGACLKTADGHNIGTVCAIDTRPRTFQARDVAVLKDLAALAMEHLESRRLAETDALTGVLSRRAFHAQGARAVALSVRHQYDLSLVTFDVDGLKAINETFGHSAGDKVLADIATACSSCLRASDIFGRLGGGEFAMLLPHTGREGALEVAERMRKAIAGMPFEPAGKPYRVTASFGVATVDMASSDVVGLLANADQALYRAKAEGRNRVVAGHAAGRAAAGWRRQRVLKAGRIDLGESAPSIDCTVRTLSDEGAGLDLMDAHGLPETFRLTIRQDGIDAPCRLVSQTERHAEVAFVQDKPA